MGSGEKRKSVSTKMLGMALNGHGVPHISIIWHQGALQSVKFPKYYVSILPVISMFLLYIMITIIYMWYIDHYYCAST